MKTQKGFTIIELIVVIAIIAVLAAVVMVNVTKYINKGKDSAIKANLNSLTTASVIFFEDHGNYGSFCNNSLAEDIFNSIAIPSGKTKECKNQSDSYTFCCHHSDTAWIACIELIEDNTKAWCVDNTGIKKQINVSDCKNGISACP